MSLATSRTAAGAAAARLEAAGRDVRVLAVAVASSLAAGPVAIPVTLGVAAAVADGPPVLTPLRSGFEDAAQSAVASLSRRERALWAGVAVVAAADVAATSLATHAESNPIGAAVLDVAGVPGMVVVKLLVVATVVLARRRLPSHHELVPGLLVLVWGAASVNNALVVLSLSF